MVQTLKKPKLHRPMWILYSCPKCRGDLFLDYEDDYYHCLQCGYIDWGFETLPYVREWNKQIGELSDNKNSN